MKKATSLLLFFALLAGFISSCKTDFDINTPYKDITIINGILNKSDSVHYIRVNKAFLGEGSALEYAKNPDSCLYPIGDIEVKLIEKTPAGIETLYICDTAWIHDKDSGTFYYPNQLVYKVKANLHQDNSYKILVKNLKSGEETYSEVSLISDFTIEKPYSFKNIIDFIAIENFFLWTSAKNGKVYQPQIKFYYSETDIDNKKDTRIATLSFGSTKSKSLIGGEKLSMTYTSESFYQMCLKQIPYVDAAKEDRIFSRKSIKVEFNMFAMGNDFSLFLDMNNSGSIATSTYTNITNGYGLFSSRYTVQRVFSLGAATQRKLNEDPLYKSLKFVAPPGK